MERTNACSSTSCTVARRVASRRVPTLFRLLFVVIDSKAARVRSMAFDFGERIDRRYLPALKRSGRPRHTRRRRSAFTNSRIRLLVLLSTFGSLHTYATDWVLNARPHTSARGRSARELDHLVIIRLSTDNAFARANHGRLRRAARWRLRRL